MPIGLERRYGQQHLHFITCTCYQRRRHFRGATARELFLRTLQEVRERYKFQLLGYVVMTDHVHLLITEPRIATPSTVMQVLKQQVSRKLSASRKSSDQRFWDRRFYDFNVWSRKKRIEKLHYMHMNPVARGLVSAPQLWPWSSFRFYQFGEVSLCTPDREPAAGPEFESKLGLRQKPHPSKSGKDGPPSNS
jgi:putative transposase